MIAHYITDSAEALAAIDSPVPKSVVINGTVTTIHTSGSLGDSYDDRDVPPATQARPDVRTMAAALPFMPNGTMPFESPHGWTGTTGAGKDEHGYYVTNGAADAQTAKYPCAIDTPMVVKIKAAGRLPNRFQINFHTAAGAYVSNVSAFVYTSAAYTPPTTDKPVELYIKFTVPSTATITQFAILFKGEADMAANPPKIYGLFVSEKANVPALPRRPVNLPWRGIGTNQIASEQTWAVHSGLTEVKVIEHVEFLKSTFALAPGDALRVMLNSDAGFVRDANGVPVSFDPVFWTHVQWLVDACIDKNMVLVPVLYFPWPWESVSTLQFDRRLMTDSNIAAGYKARSEELGRFFDTAPCVTAVDILNEYAWSISFDPNSSTTFSPQQIAACFENLAAGVRKGTSKPIIASCATGKEHIAVLALQDESSYDIVSYHCYNSPNVNFYVPHLDKPIIAGEYGPDVFEENAATKYAQTSAVQDALPSLVSAAWLWSGYGVTPPTISASGSVLSSDIVNYFVSGRVKARETGQRVIF